MKRIIVCLIVLTVVLLALPSAVLADGIIIIDPPFPVPPPDWSQWLTIRYHHVTVTIEDQVAVTEVDQVFHNDARIAVEGTYVFPLPAGAVVEDFVMWVDGTPLESRILPADEARAVYESYVQRNQDPALLEYVGRDAIQASIFPIPPGEERRVRLRYTQVLAAEDGLMHYRYPLNTERFSAKALEQVSVVVDVASSADLGALYSPTHQDQILITREGARRAHVSYEAQDLWPDRDFELYIGTRGEALGANALSFNPPGEDGFFLLLLSPSIEAASTEAIPRDLIFVLDTSGSMDGDKLEQAQAGLVYVLEHLNPGDRFNVVAFSSQVRTYAPDLVGRDAVEDASDWVRHLEALGGTNISLALSEALAQVDTDRHTTLVFLTDGLPTEGVVEESALLKGLQQEAPTDVRIFPLGVGYDVNVLLLDQIAEAHRGRPTYIEPDERIDEKISAFFARMQSPLLTDIELDFGDGIDVYDVYPAPLPDLYAGTQLIVTGRYIGNGTAALRVSGRVNDRQTSYSYEIALADHDGAGFVPRLWAARKIGHLLTQIRLNGEQTEWVDAVVALSLRYGIITPYTSFLIEEPDDSLTQEARQNAGQTLRDELTALPTAVSGQEAVEDAKLREGLGSAEAPLGGGAIAPAAPEPGDGGQPAAETRSVRYVDDKAFLCTPERCTDTAYVPDQMTSQEIVFGSARYRELLAADARWGRYFALAAETVVVDEDGTAYRLILEGSGALDEPLDVTPEPTASPPPTDPPTTSAPSPATRPRDLPLRRYPNPGTCAAPLLLLLPLLAVVVRKRGGPDTPHRSG